MAKASKINQVTIFKSFGGIKAFTVLRVITKQVESVNFAKVIVHSLRPLPLSHRQPHGPVAVTALDELFVAALSFYFAVGHHHKLVAVS
jgi:hypothetical protein